MEYFWQQDGRFFFPCCRRRRQKLLIFPSEDTWYCTCRSGREALCTKRLLVCVRLRHKNLTMAQGHLIMAPILKLSRQHQSGSYLEELHDLRFCRPPWIKPFITCWHSCPVLSVCAPWESDEAQETWWVTDNLRLCKAGRLCATASVWLCGWPCPPSHANCLPWHSLSHLSTALARRPRSPEAAGSRQKRNRLQQMGPLT